MRTSSFVILFFAFVVGWISAKLIGQYAFVADAPNIAIVDNSPKTKILVAKTAIPFGAEILAEHVSYVDVPISELPARAITNFGEVYRRQPAFPIPVNCPICEDLLIAKNSEQNTDNEGKFIPAGYKIISLDVDWRNKRFAANVNNQVEQNHDYLPVKKNIEKNNETEISESGQFLKKGNRVDIRVITRRPPKGTLATIKEHVLQTYAEKFDLDSVSELVLENVQIHNLRSYGHDAAGNNLQKISFLLEESKVEQLTNAAKKGRLRIVAHQTEKSAITQPDETTETETTVAQQKTQYKGIRHYIKKSENTQKNHTTEKTEPTVSTSISTSTTINNNKEIPEKITTVTLQKPTTPITSSTSESIAAASPFWVLPFYLRGLFDYQPPQNNKTNNTNPNTNTNINVDTNSKKTQHTLPEIKINDYENEFTSSANSHNLKINSVAINENKTEISAANNPNIVFVKPQVNNDSLQNIVPISATENIKNYTESISQSDTAGWSTTKKYMIGNSTTNNKDK
ncbi:MAG: hypothetical protein LBT09_00860 [Planctomycetaceae bacterium]|jgi:Flp pilus assembly protein CpaB|nr:hypothetical protein [Planctomycetaceae bacterium]